MRGDILNGSAVSYNMALSPLPFGAGGSGAAIDLSKFTYGTLLVLGGSVNSAFAAHVLRSGTSAGTFNGFGCSVTVSQGGKALVRSFSIDTSATWVKLFYDNGTGSANVGVAIIGQGARVVPITQPSNTTVSSDISNQ